MSFIFLIDFCQRFKFKSMLKFINIMNNSNLFYNRQMLIQFSIYQNMFDLTALRIIYVLYGLFTDRKNAIIIYLFMIIFFF